MFIGKVPTPPRPPNFEMKLRPCLIEHKLERKERGRKVRRGTSPSFTSCKRKMHSTTNLHSACCIISCLPFLFVTMQSLESTMGNEKIAFISKQLKWLRHVTHKLPFVVFRSDAFCKMWQMLPACRLGLHLMLHWFARIILVRLSSTVFRKNQPVNKKFSDLAG